MFRKSFAVAAFVALCSPAFGAPAPALVDSAWIEANSCKTGVAVVDIRASKPAFRVSRIPCSVHAPFREGWRVTANGVPGMLPTAVDLEKLIGGLGIDNKTQVVVVSAGETSVDLSSAARVYWTFKAMGHDAVSLLNGGFAGFPAGKLQKGKPGDPRPAATFKAHPRPEMVATAADVEGAAGAGILLVDNRATDLYLGINQVASVARRGTIPGAGNLPRNWLVDRAGMLHTPEDLKAIFAVAGISTGSPMITFDNTGTMGALGWFAAHELLGNGNVRLYDGSMAEWAKDPSRPVEDRAKLPGAEVGAGE
jgi:thiosulfate/3-mercaptopyruvate sulfurtransferase